MRRPSSRQALPSPANAREPATDTNSTQHREREQKGWCVKHRWILIVPNASDDEAPSTERRDCSRSRKSSAWRSDDLCGGRGSSLGGLGRRLGRLLGRLASLGLLLSLGSLRRL